MHFVYILISESNNKWSYVGSTSNTEQRLKDHNSGKTISTKGYRPLRMVYKEEFASREEAYSRELYLKSSNGRREKAKILLNI